MTRILLTMNIGSKLSLPSEQRTLESLGYKWIGFGAFGDLYRKGMKTIVVNGKNVNECIL